MTITHDILLGIMGGVSLETRYVHSRWLEVGLLNCDRNLNA